MKFFVRGLISLLLKILSIPIPGSRKDRHAVIGEGEIGLEALLNVLRHPKLKDLPFYLETPLDDAGHKEEIARLKEYLDEE